MTLKMTLKVALKVAPKKRNRLMGKILKAKDMKHMGDMLISEETSPDKNYAKFENGEVVVVLNEYTKRHGYMPISEAKEFAHSLIRATYKREQMLLEHGKGIGIKQKQSRRGEW